jgi:hypothetical protein
MYVVSIDRVGCYPGSLVFFESYLLRIVIIVFVDAVMLAARQGSDLPG